MELTPQQLCDVEFSEQWRGYSRDQVDDFIERVAAAVAALQDRLRKMTERAVRAEQRSRDGGESDGGARRALVLAQRTADATVAEAKETAARLIAQAQEEARAIILSAENSEDIPAGEPTARAEVADLEVTRSRLQADVAALESHVSDRRERIKDLLGELQRHLDEGLDWRIAQWPPAPGDRILTDEPVEDSYEYDEYEFEAIDTLSADDETDDEPIDTSSVAVDTTSAEGEADEPDVTANVDDSDDISVDLAPAPPEWEPQAEDAPPEFVDLSTDNEPEQESADRQDELAIPAPVPAYDELSVGDVDDDTFFAHLRGALDDDAPLGPREDAAGVLRWREEAATAVADVPSLYDQGDSERRKFGRKKRRQR
jgi:DivIVA domain-containing protein